MQSKCLALIFLRYYKYYLAANSAQKQWRDGQLRGSLIRKVWTPQKKTEKICTFLTTHIHQNNYFLFKPVLSLHVIICSLPSLSQYIALQSNPVVPRQYLKAENQNNILLYLWPTIIVTYILFRHEVVLDFCICALYLLKNLLYASNARTSLYSFRGNVAKICSCEAELQKL